VCWENPVPARQSLMDTLRQLRIRERRARRAMVDGLMSEYDTAINEARAAHRALMLRSAELGIKMANAHVDGCRTVSGRSTQQ
jgi:hypothetical protein